MLTKVVLVIVTEGLYSLIWVELFLLLLCLTIFECMHRKSVLFGFIFFAGLTVIAQTRLPISTLQQLHYYSNNQDDLVFVAKVNSSFVKESVQTIGGEVGSQIGDIITVRIVSDKVDLLQKLVGIEYLQLAHKIKPNLSKVIPDVRADSVYTGDGLTSGYTGKDVIIGITDWGFDYTHPMFYDTALQHTRILAAWDQFKKSGPAPNGFDYGTVYEGEDELLAAQSDTSNIYGYATHGSHVAGIAAGSGVGTEHRGVAFEANYLMVTFLVDEAAVIDAFNWMHQEAQKRNKRLVVNMSWGLYNLGPLDGTSLVSQAIDELSNQGVIFVTSGGNNGDETLHIKKEFSNDTVQSRIHFYRGTTANLWGQSVSMWGEVGEVFGASFTVYDNNKVLLLESPKYETTASQYVDTFLVIGADTIFYNVEIDAAHPLNSTPHIRLRLKSDNTSLRLGLKAFADKGTVHFYNVTELTSDVGNWGMPFSAFISGWVDGDNQYSLGEPASTRSVITVAAHQSEVFTSSGSMGGGFIAPFSSIGPTIDGRMKPDVSAPGVNVASSISSFTNRSFTLLQNVSFKGKDYPFSRFSGTSMSSPATAGVVALMLEANPNLWYNEAKEILHSTAREDIRTGDLSENGDVQWGWGKVNAYAAVGRAETKFVSTKAVSVKESLRLYPNPANDKLNLNTQESFKVQVYSSNSQQILSGEIGQNITLDVSQLNAGFYWVRFENGAHSPLRFVLTK
ncbi:MAG: hypothetical protein COA58_09600 [Bacteroidetes bacterium]|nr:MAG: hypothetical protein COA58_09600 [Bacteroidota bacterium]